MARNIRKNKLRGNLSLLMCPWTRSSDRCLAGSIEVNRPDHIDLFGWLWIVAVIHFCCFFALLLCLLWFRRFFLHIFFIYFIFFLFFLIFGVWSANGQLGANTQKIDKTTKVKMRTNLVFFWFARDGEWVGDASMGNAVFDKFFFFWNFTTNMNEN